MVNFFPAKSFVLVIISIVDPFLPIERDSIFLEHFILKTLSNGAANELFPAKNGVRVTRWLYLRLKPILSEIIYFVLFPLHAIS